MFRFFLIVLLAFFVFSWGIPSNISYAQSSVTSTNSKTTRSGEKPIEADLASWAGILDTIIQGLGREGLPLTELDKFFAEAERIKNLASTKITELQPSVDGLQQQLNELGAVPGEGEPSETDEVQLRRQTLNEQFTKVDADLKSARLAVVRTQQIQRTITQERQSRFFGSISVRNDSLFSTNFWGDFIGAHKSFFRSFDLLFEDSFSIMFNEFKKKPWKILALIFFLSLLGLIFIRLRRLFCPKLQENVLDAEHGFFSSRFARFFRHGILPIILIYAIHKLFWVLFLLTLRFDQFIVGVLIAACFYLVAIVLLRIILLPNAQDERVSNISDLASKSIYKIITVGLGIGLAVSIINLTSVILISPVELTVGLSFLFSIIIGVTALLALWVLYKDRVKRSELFDKSKTSRMFTYLNIVAWFISIAILVSAVIGYVAFAEFLAQQFIFGLIVIAVAWFFLDAIDSLFAIAAPALHVQGAQLPTAEDDASTNQFAILGSGILKLIIYLAGGILLMLPWGYRTSDFYQIFKDVFFGFEVGGLSISLSTILLAIGLFILGYTITVALRGWLNNKLLPTTKLDIGISNSISTVFGYIGFILTAVLGVSAAGFDLSNLAIVAGALSVGVGFGLQSIVNNFVSGLILLAERPIKAGDWIVTSGGEGTVKKISVRSTEIETFDRATVIVPNSTLITDNVTNWTHENKIGRIIIPVGVGYDSDPDQVRELLLECANEHKLVLGRPEPAVFFMDFGESSLDFQLRCFLADINNSLTVQSELRYAILRSLRAANIEIPFPQNDLHIRSDETKGT